MRWIGLACALLTLAARQADAPSRTAIAAWDTGRPSAAPLSPETVAGRTSWMPVARAGAAAAFKGDAVLTNGRIAVVVRRQAAAVELLTEGPQGAARARIVLQAAGGDPAATLSAVSLVENTRTGACLEASFKTARGAALAAKFRIKKGDVALEIEPGAGAARARVEAPARFAVLPDFFADDIVVDAAKIPSASAEIPSENFILHLAGMGEAIVMCVFENRDQDLRVTLAGEGENRTITGSEIQFGKDRKKVWVAPLEAPQVWHRRDVQAADAGKVIALDWKMPFPAAWRVDFTRIDDLTHSWELLLQEKEGGEYLKPAWAGGGVEKLGADRKRWMGSMLYSVVYPCWSDPQGKGYLQPLKNRWVTCQGPVILYPANRVAGTPPDAFTVLDVVRNTLGQGPCEYILDLEGQKAERKGRATCSVRDELKGIYERKEQKKSRADIERYLQQGVDFVKHIRARIEQYLAFVQQMKTYLAEQKKAHPELAETIGALEKILREADGHLEDRKDKIRTPEYVVQQTDKFRKTLMEYEGPDAAEKVKAYTDELTEIGGNQDDLVARLRWVIKTVRERAGLLVTREPKLAPVAQEIRNRSSVVLRNPAIHEEGARQ